MSTKKKTHGRTMDVSSKTHKGDSSNRSHLLRKRQKRRFRKKRRRGKHVRYVKKKPSGKKELKRVHRPALTATRGTKKWLQEMKQKVQGMIDECKKLGVKYKDRYFDLSSEKGIHKCVLTDPTTKKEDNDLSSITWPEKGVRLTDLYDDFAVFCKKGATACDVVQGELGTCFFLSALSIVATQSGLLEQLLIHHDKSVGIYAFRFFIDGDWELVVIDDYIPCVRRDEEDEGDDEEEIDEVTWRREFVSAFQKEIAGAKDDPVDKVLDTCPSDSLLDEFMAVMDKLCLDDSPPAAEIIREYASKIVPKPTPAGAKKMEKKKPLLKERYRPCYATGRVDGEVWVMLLEKAYAKVYNGFQGIDGGFVDKALVELTGGVALTTNKVPETKWDEFVSYWKRGELFSVAISQNQDDDDEDEEEEEDAEDNDNGGGSDKAMTEKKAGKGLHSGHAYAILKCVVYNGTRLVQIRNPWAEGEWKGKWSDGSKEWTAQALKDLGHKKGNDGIFWMCWDDFQTIWSSMDRTRVFSAEWSCVIEYGKFTPECRDNDRFALIVQEDVEDVYVVLNQENTRGKDDSIAQIFFRVVRVDGDDYDEIQNRPQNRASGFTMPCLYDGDVTSMESAQTRLSLLKGVHVSRGCYYILPGAVCVSGDDKKKLKEVDYQIRVYAKIKRRADFWIENLDKEDRMEAAKEKKRKAVAKKTTKRNVASKKATRIAGVAAAVATKKATLAAATVTAASEREEARKTREELAATERDIAVLEKEVAEAEKELRAEEAGEVDDDDDDDEEESDEEGAYLCCDDCECDCCEDWDACECDECECDCEEEGTDGDDDW